MRTLLIASCFLLSAFTMFGAAIPGTVILNKITLGDDSITNKSIGDTVEMKGTPKQVANTAARDAIPAARRTEGMECWVIDVGLAYRLVGGILNANWVEITVGTGSGTFNFASLTNKPPPILLVSTNDAQSLSNIAFAGFSTATKTAITNAGSGGGTGTTIEQVNAIVQTNSGALNYTIIATNAYFSNNLNTIAIAKNTLVTWSNKQYAAFIDNDLHPVIVRRDLTTGVLEKSTLSSLTVPNNDNHNNASLGFDRDGYIHLCYGMHSIALIYYKSQGPANITSFTNSAMLGSNELNVSYPIFVTDPYNGDLYFQFRSGGSGNADTYFYHYVLASKTWEAAAGTGTQGIFQTAIPTHSIYFNGAPKWDANTNLWFSFNAWITGPERGTNQYLVKYNRTNFFKYSGSAQTMPTRLDNLTPVVTIAPTKTLSLFNEFCIGTNGVIYIPYFKDDASNILQVYVAEDSTGSWVEHRLTSHTTTWSLEGVADTNFYPLIAASAAYANGICSIIFPDNFSRNKGLSVIQSADNFASIKQFYLTQERTPNFTVNYDVNRLRQSGVVSFLFEHENTQGYGTAEFGENYLNLTSTNNGLLTIVDFRPGVDATYPQPFPREAVMDSIVAKGQIKAGKFVGNGSGLNNVTDTNAVHRTDYEIWGQDVAGLTLSGDDNGTGLRAFIKVEAGEIADIALMPLNGFVGIGEEGPLYKLQVKGASQMFKLESTTAHSFNPVKTTAGSWEWGTYGAGGGEAYFATKAQGVSGLANIRFYAGEFDTTLVLQVNTNGGVSIGTSTMADPGSLLVSGTVSVADEAYSATTWNGNSAVPTKNAIRDAIVALGGSGTDSNAYHYLVDYQFIGPGLSGLQLISGTNTSNSRIDLATSAGGDAGILLTPIGVAGVGIGVTPTSPIRFQLQTTAPNTTKIESTSASSYNLLTTSAGSSEWGIYGGAFYFTPKGQNVTGLQHGIRFYSDDLTTVAMQVGTNNGVSIGTTTRPDPNSLLVASNVTASFFIGDGSLLTGIAGGGGLDPRIASSSGTMTAGSNTFAATTLVGTKVFSDEVNATNSSSLVMTAGGLTLNLGSSALTLSGASGGFLGVGGGLTYTGSGNNGNLTTSVNTLQELNDAVDNLSLGAGGGATNAVTTVSTNGVALTTAATNLNFWQGTGIMITGTNLGGLVGMRFDAGSALATDAEVAAAYIASSLGAGTNNSFTGSTNYGNSFRTNWTWMDARGWHNTNNSAANQGVDISAGAITANSFSAVTFNVGTVNLTNALSLAGGGTGSSLSDPGAHRLWGWDDTDGAVKWFTLGSGLSYDAPTDTISATGGGSASFPLITNTMIVTNFSGGLERTLNVLTDVSPGGNGYIGLQWKVQSTLNEFYMDNSVLHFSNYGAGNFVFDQGVTVTGDLTVQNDLTVEDALIATSLSLATDGTLQIPRASVPAIDALGKMGVDTDLYSASRGAVMVYDGTEATVLVGVLATETPVNGQTPVWNTGGTVTWNTGPSLTGTNAWTGSNYFQGITAFQSATISTVLISSFEFEGPTVDAFYTRLTAVDPTAIRTNWLPNATGVLVLETNVTSFSNKKITLSVGLLDDTYTGTDITGMNAGATVAQWETVYLSSGAEWVLADANGSSTYPAIALAAAAGTDNNPMTVVVSGTIRNDAWSWTVGGTIYLSATPGALTQTAPSGSGDKVQVMGVALSADIMLLKSSSDYGTAP